MTRLTIGALPSSEHQGRDKLRRTNLKQPSALFCVAGGYWLLKMRQQGGGRQREKGAWV